MGMVEQILAPVMLPRMVRIRQHFDATKIDDVADDLLAEHIATADRIHPSAGRRICLTAGSRGVDNIALILKTVAATSKPRAPSRSSFRRWAVTAVRPPKASSRFLRIMASPRIMRLRVISQYGYPGNRYNIRWTARFDRQTRCHCRRYHRHRSRQAIDTGFRGPYESGLMKMMAIGLGKQRGAEACH